MRVLFVLENTMDNLEGGTEVSSRHLARLLRKQRVGVEEWSPYSKRMSIYFYTAIFFQIVIFLLLLWKCVKNRPQILHIQGKYLLPPTVLVGRILNIPMIATIRDYIVVCPIGLCLFEFNKGYSLPRQRVSLKYKHGFWHFLSEEIPLFLLKYHSANSIFIKIFKYVFLIRGWFVSQWLKYWLKKTDAIISVSKATQQILERNGILSQSIYNSFDVNLSEKVSPLKVTPLKVRPCKTILFVGKPSYGKGYDIFQELSQMKEFKQYEFKTIGGATKLSYEDTLKEIGKALAVVVSSRWPEPFGRVALEALMLGTPVVASKRGGLPEIVEDRITGILAEPTIAGMTDALKLAIRQNHKLRTRIKNKRKFLENKFGLVPLKLHLDLYSQLLDNIQVSHVCHSERGQ